MESKESEILVLRENYPTELVEFLRADTESCDFVVECAGKERVKCHGCVLRSQFRISGRSVSTNLPRDVVSSLVDFCYTGHMRATPENVVYYLEGAVLLKSKPEFLGTLERYFLSSVDLILEQESLIPRLPEEVLRRTIVEASSSEVWMRLLFVWWNGELKKRQKAYVEMVEELSVLTRLRVVDLRNDSTFYDVEIPQEEHEVPKDIHDY